MDQLLNTMSSSAATNATINFTMAANNSKDNYRYDNNNNTSFDDEDDNYELYPDFTQLEWVRLVFIALYLVVMVLAICGNSMVCITVLRNRNMHTAVNYYIVNLGVCDLLVGVFVLPGKLLELTAPGHWEILNAFSCTALNYLQTIVVFTSVLTLVATCVERYYAIVHPLESRVHHSKARAKRILLAVWALPCLVAAPNLYPSRAWHSFLYSQYGAIHRLTCMDNLDQVDKYFRPIYFSILFLLIYLLPLGFIAGTCFHIAHVLLKDIYLHRQGSLRRQENNRRKVAKMVMVVVVAFTVSWTPYFLVSIVTQCHNYMEERHFFFTMLTINFLAFTNSCVNPFIYAAMSARFRHGFQSMLCFGRRRHRTHRGGSRVNTTHRVGSFSEGSGSLESAPSTRSSPQYSIFRLESLRKFSRRTLALALRAGGSSRKKRQETEAPTNANTLNSVPTANGRCSCHAALTQAPNQIEENTQLPTAEFQLKAIALEASLTAYLIREADKKYQDLFMIIKTETKPSPVVTPQKEFSSTKDVQTLTASMSMPDLNTPILPFIDESVQIPDCPTTENRIHRWASEGALTKLKETAL